MSLNNWLCKHFDEEKKGYVTIEDAVNPFLEAIPLIVVLFIIFLVIGGFSANYQNMVTTEYPRTFSELFIVLIKAWILPIEVIIGVVVILTIVYYILKLIDKISQIKIAKCPLKKQEENK